MLKILSIACLIGALILLGALATTDFKYRRLPDRLTAALALTGLIFHYATNWHFITPLHALAGGAAGFMFLYAIRMAANRFYGRDALGLGDVKLMAAAGLWLGVQNVMLALTLGALAGILQGIAYGLWQSLHLKTKIDFAHMQVAAGPGFAIGIIITGLMEFWNFAEVTT